jgi:FkbH-like protein
MEAQTCVERARDAAATDVSEALLWLRRAVDAEPHFRAWLVGAKLLDSLPKELVSGAARRTVRVAVVGSYTTSQFVPMLRLAAFRAGVDIEVHEGNYDQYQQELIDPSSAVYAFDPDFVVLAVHEGALRLPPYSADPDGDMDRERARWLSLWSAVRRHGHARVIQHTFATRPETPFGHLSVRSSATRESMIRALNGQLGAAAGNDVLAVDCDRLASSFGKRRWFDDRYWYLSKQAVALDALPTLALHTAAVIAGDLGLAKKCLVLDLDNTLWGGVVGEDGVEGLQLGEGPEGEAYAAFQEAVLALKRRGIVLAVCSKNNETDALSAFERHPAMRLRRDDFAAFVANWDHKPDNLRRIASDLGLGLDAFVYADDNAAEREVVRRSLPEVDVIPLTDDPALYARTILEYPFFESSTYSAEDARRTEQYRARHAIAELATSVVDLPSFLRGLEMEAVVAPFDAEHLPRIVQLIGKTNQFNLTTRRHGLADVERFMADPEAICIYLELVDKFADHGLVAVAIARKEEASLDIDTLLVSCRVIGRTVERVFLARLCVEARRLGCERLVGRYAPTAKNELVRTMYGDHGFVLEGEQDGTTIWHYDLTQEADIANEFISTGGVRA